MAAGQQVTLTFAGDSAKLEQAFDRVGGAARSMEGDVKTAASSFDRVGEAADTVDTRAMGFRDTLTGLQDGFAGIKKVNEDGLGFESLLLLGFGLGDLASGMFNLVVPAMKSMVLWAGNTKVGMMVAAGATKLWAAAQQMLNLSFWVSPIGLIVLAVVALVAVIVLIATKTTWFQDLWRVVWTNVKKWAVAFWDWIKNLPSMLGRAFSALTNIITAPFRAAFNAIGRLWNSTVGKLSFNVPSWVPIIGGNGFSMPQVPTFHAGGVVPGPPGREVLALLQAGERVTPAGGSGGGLVLEVHTGGSRLDDLLVEIIARAVRNGDIDLRAGVSGA